MRPSNASTSTSPPSKIKWYPTFHLERIALQDIGQCVPEHDEYNRPALQPHLGKRGDVYHNWRYLSHVAQGFYQPVYPVYKDAEGL